MACEHRYQRRVEFGDTDMAGIVHFSWYFRYAEEAEHSFYRSLGLSVHQRGDDTVVGLPRAGARIEFLKPLRCEDLVDVHIWVKRKGTKSIVYQFRMSKGGDAVAKGEVAVISCRTHPDGRIESTPLDGALSGRIEEAPYPPLDFK
jgi:acyl-CoA thioester hydrolase